MKYRFFKKKPFESMESYELRLNEEANQGWRIINIIPIGGLVTALLEKIDRERVY